MELSCCSTAPPSPSLTCQQHYCIWPWTKVFWKLVGHTKGSKKVDERQRRKGRGIGELYSHGKAQEQDYVEKYLG